MKKLFILIFSFSIFSASLPLIGADLAGLTPPDAAIVLNIKVGKFLGIDLLRKEIFKGLLQQLPADKKGPAILGALIGTDFLKQIDEISVFGIGKDFKPSKAPDFGVLLKTTMNLTKFLGEIRDIQKESGVHVLGTFEGMDCLSEEKNRREVLLVLDDSTLFFGTASVAASVAQMKNKPPAENDSKINGLLKKTDTGALVWGVGIIPSQLSKLAASTPQTAPLASVSAVFLSVNFQEDFALNAAAEIEGKECLENLSTSLNGFLALGKLSAGALPDVGQILNTTKIESSETAVKLSMKFPIKNLEGIAKIIKERGNLKFSGETKHPVENSSDDQKKSDKDDKDKAEKSDSEKKTDETKDLKKAEKDPNSDVEVEDDDE
ncbi:MAG: hypothetical protein HQM08_04150 [Candidatus Riflebacteria bacterium]|nr:hypothetical protein [Candidatus Riflebacteria bacterium]